MSDKPEVIKQYPIKMEIAGSFAMWNRSDTAEPFSYPAPTQSACKGIFEAILRLRGADVTPCAIEICSMPRWESYSFNCRNDLRKTILISNNQSFQVRATVLRDVRYRLYAIVEQSQFDNERNNNSAHAYYDIFNRRLKRGQSFGSVCLGWSEFLAEYFGPFTNAPVIPYSWEGKMRRNIFDKPQCGKVSPTFTNAVIENGVLKYHPVNLGDWDDK